MRGHKLRLGLTALLCGLLAGNGAWFDGAWAQSPAPSDGAIDPPSRVGRLSEIEGAVSFHTSDQDQWSPAMINYPVTAGSSFWTEPNARAALEAGPASIRMASQTEFDVVALDDHNFQGQIGQGAINLRLFALPAGDGFQIVTARGTIQITAPGRYHIDGGTDATPTLVTVFDGAAQFVGNNANLAIHPSETARVSGVAAGPLTYDVAGAQPDALDRWATERDDRRPVAQAPRYVSAEMTGYQDLDASGAWSQTASDGPVWYPANMPADWAPYRHGHWAYVEPWGWTWIDDASWGFAPFHYGRWARDHDRWGWYPGAVVERPVYAPALVAFVGEPPRGPGLRAGLEIGIGIGAIAAAAAWIPLGPHEAYEPSFRHSPAYVRNVNINHVTNVNVTNITVNRTVNNYVNASAVTVVPASAMVGSQPVGRAAVAVPAAQLAGRTMASAPPAVRPTLATTGATPTGIRAAGGPVDPAHARPAAPGPLAAPGRPATAVALSRVEPPPAGTRAAPPRVVASAPASGQPTAQPSPASQTPPTATPSRPPPVAAAPSPPSVRPGAAPASPTSAAVAPPPVAAAPGPPIVRPGAPPQTHAAAAPPPVAAPNAPPVSGVSPPAGNPPRGGPIASAPRPPEIAPRPTPPQPAVAPRPADVAPRPPAPQPPQPAAAPPPAPHPAPPPVVARAPAVVAPPPVMHEAPPPHPVADMHRAPPPAPPPPRPAPPPPVAHAAPPPAPPPQAAHAAPPAHPAAAPGHPAPEHEHKDEHH